MEKKKPRNAGPLSEHIDADVTIHICPQCSNNIASGLDAKGEPALCEQCLSLNKLKYLRILPAREHPRISGARRKRR